MYTYNAKILKVIDGDTVELLVDMGMHHWIRQRIRFTDIDTAELRSSCEAERVEAKRAKEFVENALAFSLKRETTLLEHLNHPDVIIKTEKEGSFGRFIATVQIVGDERGTIGYRLKLAGLEKKESYDDPIEDVETKP
jgi:micrococcal nuclease